MIGRTIGRYRVLAKLGEGGMGVVYAAEDTRLGRRVALKFLPERLARDRDPSTNSGSPRARSRDEALDRFQREARAASALNHPHICTIYDIGEAEPAEAAGSGRAGGAPAGPYIAMELLEGQTLRERLHRADSDAGGSPSAQGRTPLRVAEIVDLGLQLADALEAAHAKGILHRDIKPANIFLTTRGTAKLLDFGVAKLLSEPHPPDTDAETTAGEWVTGERVTLGTVGYMSPEQVRGEALDARTDLFSLGVVLYEMATGLAPFRGATSGVVLTEILTKAPTAPVRLNPDVPADLERIVNQLLEKDRALRCQSAADLRADLDRLRRALSISAVAPPAGPEPLGLARGSASSVEGERAPASRAEQASIVVLPFQNLSPDPDNAYFADGLTEEIIADLSNVRALRVISRTSAMRYQGTTKSLPEIAAELKVRHVLEGSVRKAGRNLRITAQLIDAATDAHLWAEKYGGTIDDIFDVQENVSRAIVKALRIHLSPVEMSRIARRDIPDPEAYDDWLRVRHLVRTYRTAGLDDAVARLEAGLKRIGDNPALMAGLAFVYCAAAMLGAGGDEELDRAAAWAARALALDPTVAQANVTLATVEILRGRPDKALCLLRAALASEPGDWDTHQWLAYVYAGVGRHDQAVVHAHALVAIDPGESLGEWWVGWILLYAGRNEEAVAAIGDQWNELTNPHRRFMAGFCRAWLGQWQLAEEILAPVEASEAFDYITQLSLLFRDAIRGDRGAFRRDFTPPMIQSVRADAWGACTVAECYAILGDNDAALHWLDRAANWGWMNYPLYSRTDPFLVPLRGDPRFQAFQERVKVQWEQFEA